MNGRKLSEMRTIFLFSLLAAALIHGEATADMLSFSMPENVDGANPSGMIGAVIQDVGVNDVQLTMIVDLKGKNEYVSEWAFNLDKLFVGFDKLTATFVGSKGGASAADSVILGRNGFTFAVLAGEIRPGFLVDRDRREFQWACERDLRHHIQRQIQRLRRQDL